ncbi:hypothetical protein RR46_08665 [Papilio xuthus]|uniref:C-type lectin domain-containing protein n=1 Tax=Papilio xuthus TaxID=66420 RepID=A0A194Q7X8_PAPXU|nr:hypothetical protein RR46_08665 [Papilio xuthus]
MEALERRGKLLAIAAIVFIVFWSQCPGVDGHRNSTKMSYVCPPQFIRLGHSCYFFSDNKATWQNALFACKINMVEIESVLTGGKEILA